MSRRRIATLAASAALVLAVGGLVLAQRMGGPGGFGPGGGYRGGGRGRPRPTIGDDRNGVPDWKVDARFAQDVFTFVRIEYDSMGGWGGRRGGGGRWATDYPDSDLNFSYRLQQLTSLKVAPTPLTMRLTDPRLPDYPFIYIIEPGALVFSEEEVVALRRYLDNGGFLMVDDFWGDSEYDNFEREILRVYPERKPEELPLEHPIFQCVYPLKEKPQVPSIMAAIQGRDEGVTWEWHHDGDVRTPHYRGIHDAKGRLAGIICHNTDLGDGWEREGEDPWYFNEFSVKKAYPIGINIITYAMTH